MASRIWYCHAISPVLVMEHKSSPTILKTGLLPAFWDALYPTNPIKLACCCLFKNGENNNICIEWKRKHNSYLNGLKKWDQLIFWQRHPVSFSSVPMLTDVVNGLCKQVLEMEYEPDLSEIHCTSNLFFLDCGSSRGYIQLLAAQCNVSLSSLPECPPNNL